ncbi:MAG: hypothetical protein H0T78_10165 [Longispora sp.]|nr:hypothetical protein [Longispora sp. (in: high G+C Gram-positive bacteria)]
MASCQERLARVRVEAADVVRTAKSAAHDPLAWGTVCLPFGVVYWSVGVRGLHRNLDLMNELLQERVEAMRMTRQSYCTTDDRIAEALNGINRESVEKWEEVEGARRRKAKITIDVEGDIDVDIKVTPHTSDRFGSVPGQSRSMPGQSGTARCQAGPTEKTQSTYDDAAWKTLESILGSADDFQSTVVDFLSDPINVLITAGLDFLITVIDPLNDLLSIVTGDPKRMQGEISRWTEVRSSLGSLAEEVRSAAKDGLLGWEGRAADAARQRLNDFADGMLAVANDIHFVEVVLGLAKAIVEALRQFVLSLIADFIEWLIMTWIPAIAAAPPTMGTSLATASTATTVKSGIVLNRGVRFVDKAARIVGRLEKVLSHTHPERAARTGMKTATQVVEKSAKDGLKPLLSGIADGMRESGSGIREYREDQHRASDREIRGKLSGK